MIPGPVRTRLSKLFEEFFQSERGSGIILVFCTAASIAIANSALGESYLAFWHTKIGFEIEDILSLKYSVQHWINDGLMAVFFLLVGFLYCWRRGALDWD